MWHQQALLRCKSDWPERSPELCGRRSVLKICLFKSIFPLTLNFILYPFVFCYVSPICKLQITWSGQRSLLFSLTSFQFKVEPAGVGVVVEAGHMCMVRILHFYFLHFQIQSNFYFYFKTSHKVHGQFLSCCKTTKTKTFTINCVHKMIYHKIPIKKAHKMM